MVKCELCNRKIATTFLGKIVGTVVYDSGKKKRYVCKDCQSEHSEENLHKVIENA
ncbi:MAG: hypothetical protein ACLFTH_04560 [Candidatus Woesearchaeota archaeon]